MKSPFWLAKEVVQVRSLYEAGERVTDIALKIGRPARSVRLVVGRMGLHRPEGYRLVRENSAWPRIKAALEKRPMTRAEVMEASGVTREHALRAIRDHHGADIYICRWIQTTRKPAAVFAIGTHPDAPKPVKVRRVLRAQANPFLVAAGAIAAPKSAPGRVFIHLHDDELEIAA